MLILFLLDPPHICPGEPVFELFKGGLPYHLVEERGFPCLLPPLRGEFVGPWLAPGFLVPGEYGYKFPPHLPRRPISPRESPFLGVGSVIGFAASRCAVHPVRKLTVSGASVGHYFAVGCADLAHWSLEGGFRHARLILK
ncbi:hypothetical protein LIER_34909 [Lithospermum erythrorhizon]|uniref:Uncharacterized protein n=1 Tax=Lithospermum erythrorhizon TaxID=34254 RepID=A0AAV3NG14_LITER